MMMQSHVASFSIAQSNERPQTAIYEQEHEHKDVNVEMRKVANKSVFYTG